MLPAWTFDEHRVVRAHRPDHAEPAAFLTLLSLWRVEIELDAFAGAPPDRVARYDMPAMVRQLEFETYDTPSLTEALKFDLPVLLRLGEDPGGGPAGAVTVLRMEGDLLTVADPLRGRRTVKRSEIEPRVRRAFVVYRDPHRWNSLTRGAEGPVVESLQRALQGLSLDVGPIDGKFGAKLADALGEFQRLHRLPVVLDRIAPMTAAMLCTLYDDHRPRLYS
jgi:hypothetical protein